RGNNCQRQSEQYRYAETIDQPRHNVATAIVGAQPIGLHFIAFGEPVTGGKLAIFLSKQPGRLGREWRRRFAHLRVVGKTHRRPDYDASFLVNQIHQVIVAKVGGCAEQVRVMLLGKYRVGIRDHGRKERPSMYEDENWLVIADELGEQRYDEQR